MSQRPSRLPTGLDSHGLQCPSAQPEMPGARAFGVIDYGCEEPQLSFLDQVTAVSPELLALAKPLQATQVFRFAAPCQGGHCRHWHGEACTLVDRIVELLPVASLTLPPCRIRSECRWFAQHRRQACLRCPQVVTQNEQPTEKMVIAATLPGK